MYPTYHSHEKSLATGSGDGTDNTFSGDSESENFFGCGGGEDEHALIREGQREAIVYGKKERERIDELIGNENFAGGKIW